MVTKRRFQLDLHWAGIQLTAGNLVSKIQEHLAKAIPGKQAIQQTLGIMLLLFTMAMEAQMLLKLKYMLMDKIKA